MTRKALAITALTAALALGTGTGPASAADELIGYPGPDGVIWIPEQVGSGGFVSGGLNARLDTYTTFACEGDGSIEVTFVLDNHPDRNPAPFTLACAPDSPTRTTVPLGTALSGGFGATATASSPSIRWGATVVQPE